MRWGLLWGTVLLMTLLCAVTAVAADPAAPPEAAGSMEATSLNIQTPVLTAPEPPVAAAAAAAPETPSPAAPLSAFPSLHPLTAHFPIALLPTALLFVLVGILVRSEGTLDAGMALTILGFIGAVLVEDVFRPQPGELTEAARQLLALHETAARLTIVAACAAAVFGGLRWLVPPVKGLFAVLLLAGLIAASAAVLLTGYYGAALVHLHGVGPLGVGLAG